VDSETQTDGCPRNRVNFREPGAHEIAKGGADFFRVLRPDQAERTQLRPDTYLEWSNSEINTTGRNDVPAEPVRIEVRRWLRSGGWLEEVGEMLEGEDLLERP